MSMALPPEVMKKLLNTSLSREFHPLEHYDYGILDQQCTCAVCTEWRTHLTAYSDMQKLTIFQTCKKSVGCFDMRGSCHQCSKGMQARSRYLSSLYRRDLYCESSFHAAAMPRQDVGLAYMHWLTQILFDRSNYSEGWWITQGGYRPIAFWLVMFKRTHSGEPVNLDTIDATEISELPKTALSSIAAAASGY